jgi:hypothetical protein
MIGVYLVGPSGPGRKGCGSVARALRRVDWPLPFVQMRGRGPGKQQEHLIVFQGATELARWDRPRGCGDGERLFDAHYYEEVCRGWVRPRVAP